MTFQTSFHFISIHLINLPLISNGYLLIIILIVFDMSIMVDITKEKDHHHKADHESS